MITRLHVIAIAAAVLLGLIVGGIAAWYWQDNRWSARLSRVDAVHSDTLAEIARVAAGQVQLEQEKRAELERQRRLIDEHYFKEYTDVTSINAELVADLAAARQRLSVRAAGAICPGGVPPAAGAPGMDDGAGARADLHPAVAAGVVGVTGRADECRVRLGALQEWVRGVVGE
ncbi:lysis system i-spanin subunit Rz [Halopseudomonas phragmitis]|uniref:Lysis protein n=1 Tax=Halopseudomonas phragmitis TaxID=1931241 RepID=A0A1V0B9N2_9GAMM|nr:lysis system i-spanin subunit Rz [Halopseudomonas phragmitis]AQZ96622.1 hypothetical protein BVH74_18505 [Halopseudomonas phragmitis]